MKKIIISCDKCKNEIDADFLGYFEVALIDESIEFPIRHFCCFTCMHDYFANRKKTQEDEKNP